jgi:hypothetical protein
VLTGLVIDALDPARAERFWRDATGGRTEGLRLRFVPAAGPRTAKNRLHLDLAGGPDWPAEVARLLALGATRADIGQGDAPWDVLADPEGHEFCVLRPGHPGVRADRGLAAICLDVTEEERAAQRAFWAEHSHWRAVESDPGCDRLRRHPGSRVALVLGPPAAPRSGRNRVRLEVTDTTIPPGEHTDPGGNEFHVVQDAAKPSARVPPPARRCPRPPPRRGPTRGP